MADLARPSHRGLGSRAMGPRRGRRAVLLLSLLTAAAVAQPAHADTAPATCNGDARLCTRAFDQVVLPGTHNAMSNRALGWSIPNQQLRIIDQLRGGIRALLLDTYY